MSLKRGEIYFVNLDLVQGKEQASTRPVLILSIDSLNQSPLVITVIVGTEGENIKRDFPTNVRVLSEESGLSIETIFLGFQLRSIDESRFSKRPSGRLTESKMLEIEATVRYCLGL